MTDRFCIGRPLGRLLPRQVQILDGFLRVATARVVMRQLTVMVVQGGPIQCFNRLRGLLMQDFTPLLQHRAISDLLGQGVLKNIFHLGKGGLLVEKFFVLEGGKEAIQFVFWLGDNLADQDSRELTTDDRKLLKNASLLARGGRCGRRGCLGRWGEMESWGRARPGRSDPLAQTRLARVTLGPSLP